MRWAYCSFGGVCVWRSYSTKGDDGAKGAAAGRLAKTVEAGQDESRDQTHE